MRELFTIINGEIVPPTDSRLGLRQGAFLETLDVKGRTPLFANPFGNYSSVSLLAILDSLKRRKRAKQENSVTLEDAVSAVRGLQKTLENELDQQGSYGLIDTYCALKGYHISEVAEQVEALGAFVTLLRSNPQGVVDLLLNSEANSENSITSRNVLPSFGIVASGNLGLFEIGTLIYAGIIAQAAKNGNQFSLIVKPSSEDFLFWDLIMRIPENFRHAFSRITWRSDVAWDEPLMSTLLNALDGAIYFGKRSTLLKFKSLLGKSDCLPYHHYYYDHFPLMVVGRDANSEHLKAAAKTAVNLCYKGKGEACLSLQDIFVHRSVYQAFLPLLRQEIDKINYGSLRATLPMFSSDFLFEFADLRDYLMDDGATVSGRINYEKNKMDLLLACDINVDSHVLGTENAAPFLCVAPYENCPELLVALKKHLGLQDAHRTTDKHIYSMVVGECDSKLILYLKQASHRLIYISGADLPRKIAGFKPFNLGVPHCGGISFLADLFGVPHQQQCCEDY